MKRGNFRTKKVYPEKGKIRFEIQIKINGVWKKFGKDEIDFTFENQEIANTAMISILDFSSKVKNKIKLGGIVAFHLAPMKPSRRPIDLVEKKYGGGEKNK